MAKIQPWPTLQEMESALKRRLTPTGQIQSSQRFYSDLRPVLYDSYEMTRKEYTEHYRSYAKSGESIEAMNLVLDALHTQTKSKKNVTVRRLFSDRIFATHVDIDVKPNLNLPLLFSQIEATHVQSVMKLQANRPLPAASPLFSLPKEIRHRIFSFAIAHGEWRIEDSEIFDTIRFPRAIGDPSGFFFPLSKQLGSLLASTDMRSECLPIAFRKTRFVLDDIDDVVKLLIGIGEIGRDNIESLQFPWESRTDSEIRWEKSNGADDFALTLPELHVDRCVKLLRSCRRLKSLTLLFESDLIRNIHPKSFKENCGICGLCSLRGLKEVHIWSTTYEPLEQAALGEWLRNRIGKGVGY